MTGGDDRHRRMVAGSLMCCVVVGGNDTLNGNGYADTIYRNQPATTSSVGGDGLSARAAMTGSTGTAATTRSQAPPG